MAIALGVLGFVLGQRISNDRSALQSKLQTGSSVPGMVMSCAGVDGRGARFSVDMSQSSGVVIVPVNGMTDLARWIPLAPRLPAGVELVAACITGGCVSRWAGSLPAHLWVANFLDYTSALAIGTAARDGEGLVIDKNLRVIDKMPINTDLDSFARQVASDLARSRT